MRLYDAIPNHTKAFVLVKESLSKQDRAILAEAGIASDADLEKLLKGIAKDLEAKKLSTKGPEEIDLDTIESDPTIKEDVLEESLTITLILASPTLLKLLGKLIDWVYAKIALSSEQKKELADYKEQYKAAEKSGDKKAMHDLHDKVHASALGKLLAKASHGAHAVLVSPIAVLLKGMAFMSKNKWLKENYKEAANLIFAILMIGYAGYGIWHSLEGIASVKSALAHLGTNMEKLTHLTVDATKGTDMTVEVLKVVLAKIFKG